MAERWDERERAYRPDERDERSRSYGERPRSDRAADEVRSWFGDDEAAQRRRMDEYRDSRDRDWDNRATGAVGRSWDRARDTMRDVTDRDRDGRRGLAEWNDDDRAWDRPRYSSAAPVTGRGVEYGSRERAYADSSAYSDDRPYPASRSSVRAPGTYGEYTGRGPRGYKRGDQRILEDVCDRLTDDPRIDASDIEVNVKDGEVTLGGSVRTREEKRYSEDLIEHLSGVRDVNNHLKVRPPDQVIGTARSGSSMLGLTDTPPPPPAKATK